MVLAAPASARITTDNGAITYLGHVSPSRARMAPAVRSVHSAPLAALRPRPALVHRSECVYAGERVGAVGETGNAITVGCHLHFEIHVRGVPIDPESALRR